MKGLKENFKYQWFPPHFAAAVVSAEKPGDVLEELREMGKLERRDNPGVPNGDICQYRVVDLRAKTLAELGLTQVELTVQIILEPAVLDGIDMSAEANKKLAKAIVEALGLTGKFRVNPYGWNFSPDGPDDDLYLQR